MRLTDRTDYALRVLLVLASDDRRRSVGALADALGVSRHHLAKVVQSMHDRGWVHTSAGRGGGVELAMDASSISIADVVRAMEPDMALVECHRTPGVCVLEPSCRLRSALDGAMRAFLHALERETVADLVLGRTRALLTLTMGAP